jgi:hypothetical protein
MDYKLLNGAKTMNNSPIEQANDIDLVGSVGAMRRAAIRARQIAAQTGTALIVWRDGKICREMVIGVPGTAYLTQVSRPDQE